MTAEESLLIEGRELIESSLSHVSHGGPTRADAEKWLYKVNQLLGKRDAEQDFKPAGELL